MYPVTNIRKAVVDYFEYMAAWHDGKARGNADDERNARSAKWLRNVAEHIAELKDDDLLLKRLASMKHAFVAPDGDIVESLATDDGTASNSSDYASGQSFDPRLSPGEFLGEWADWLEVDCSEWAKWFKKQQG